MTPDIINQLQGKAVAITGASGYIGSSIVNKLTENSVRTIRVCRKKIPKIDGVKDIFADVRNDEIWNEIVEQSDIIVCLAGNTSVYAAEGNIEESLTSSLLPINNLILAAKNSNKVPRVVFASTATVYGMTDKLPVSETAKLNPITIYDLHKVFAEQQLEMASRQGFISSASLRLANVYGPSLAQSSSRDRGVINKIARDSMLGKDLQVFGDGEFIRDYVFIDDVVSAFLYAACSKNVDGRSFNISSGIGHTIKEVFELIANKSSEVIGKKVNVNFIPMPKDVSPIEYRNYIGDSSLFHSVTEWSSKVSLQAGVDSLIGVFQEEVQYG